MKENKKPILSICIPTWNRWYALQHTLKSIMNQDEFKSGDVEIVISDNASTDETEVEIGKLCKKYKNIRYSRNKENIGGNPNINKSLSLGEGEYLWLLGSDTIIYDQGIDILLNLINNHKVDIIYNLIKGSNNFSHIKNNYDDISNVYYFKNTKDFFIHLGKQYSYDKNSWILINYIITFASCICISKNFYNNSIRTINKLFSKEDFNKNYFSQELICFVENANNGIIINNHELLYRYHTRKTGYLHKYGIVKDMKFLIQFIQRKYGLASKEFNRLSNKIISHWYDNYIRSLVIRFLNKIGLYKFLSKLRRKYILKNWDATKGSYMENIE